VRATFTLILVVTIAAFLTGCSDLNSQRVRAAYTLLAVETHAQVAMKFGSTAAMAVIQFLVFLERMGLLVRR